MALNVPHFFRKYSFLLGLLGAVLVGINFPGLSALNPEGVATSAIVIGMFFIIGMTLPSESIIKGIIRPKTHIYLQCVIFIINPVIFFIMTYLTKSWLHPQLYAGILALSVLPTTISSSTIYTQNSGGNTVAAMFNSVLSNSAGIIVSPLLLSILLNTSGHSVPAEILIQVVRSLFFKSLAPLLAGQLLRWKGERMINHHLNRLKAANNILILLLVLLSLANSAESPSFISNLPYLGLPACIMVIGHLAVLFVITRLNIFLKLPEDDRIAAVFTGSQKTLGMGVPLISTFFSQSPEMLGLVLLPILFYHPMELVIAGLIKNHSWIAKKPSRRSQNL